MSCGALIRDREIPIAGFASASILIIAEVMAGAMLCYTATRRELLSGDVIRVLSRDYGCHPRRCGNAFFHESIEFYYWLPPAPGEMIAAEIPHAGPRRR